MRMDFTKLNMNPKGNCFVSYNISFINLIMIYPADLSNREVTFYSFFYGIKIKRKAFSYTRFGFF